MSNIGCAVQRGSANNLDVKITTSGRVRTELTRNETRLPFTRGEAQ